MIKRILIYGMVSGIIMGVVLFIGGAITVEHSSKT
jgi:hypothetical protein